MFVNCQYEVNFNEAQWTKASVQIHILIYMYLPLQGHWPVSLSVLTIYQCLVSMASEKNGGVFLQLREDAGAFSCFHFRLTHMSLIALKAYHMYTIIPQ